MNLGSDLIYNILISINYQTCEKVPVPVSLAYLTRQVYRVAISDFTLYKFCLGHVAGNERALPGYSLLVVQLIRPPNFFSLAQNNFQNFVDFQLSVKISPMSVINTSIFYY